MQLKFYAPIISQVFFISYVMVKISKEDEISAKASKVGIIEKIVNPIPTSHGLNQPIEIDHI